MTAASDSPTWAGSLPRIRTFLDYQLDDPVFRAVPRVTVDLRVVPVAGTEAAEPDEEGARKSQLFHRRRDALLAPPGRRTLLVGVLGAGKTVCLAELAIALTRRVLDDLERGDGPGSDRRSAGGGIADPLPRPLTADSPDPIFTARLKITLEHLEKDHGGKKQAAEMHERDYQKELTGRLRQLHGLKIIEEGIPRSDARFDVLVIGRNIASRS